MANKTKFINVRVDEQTHKKFKDMLGSRKQSEFIRELLDKNEPPKVKVVEKVIERVKTKKVIVDNYNRDRIYLLNSISNNINQIAKHCNTKKRLDSSVLKKLDDILSTLKGL